MIKRLVKYRAVLQLRIPEFCAKYSTTASENVNKRQLEIMSKGLPKSKPIPGVKKIFLVASGKGGVGKSTTAVNLAVALHLKEPKKTVGILDADVFGPSIPLMMNLQDTPLLNENNLMIPLVNYGIKCMSMGFLIAEGAPVIWRGLMVMQALNKLLWNVHWDSVDYLIIDTPPGTGDTHLSLVQNIPIAGVILVTTPQPAAVQVTKRGAVMFQKLKVPIVGIIENMSFIKCPSCLNDISIYDSETANLASEMNTTILEKIPFVKDISNSSDKGIPVVISKPESIETDCYSQLATKIINFCTK